MLPAAGKVIIYGGRGALGAKCVSHFKSKSWWVGSIDLRSNENADFNVLVNCVDNLPDQEERVLKLVNTTLKGVKLDAVICVAGGWVKGDAKKDLAKCADMMWRQSVWSAIISSSIAAHHLKDGGLLTLFGAKAALEETPGMIAYGIAKAAVHQLTKSLANPDSSLPKNSVSVSVLPLMLDTPGNRQLMPNGDFSTWTPLEFLTELLWKWSVNEGRPVTGSLLQLVTKDNKTEIMSV